MQTRSNYESLFSLKFIEILPKNWTKNNMHLIKMFISREFCFHRTIIFRKDLLMKIEQDQLGILPKASWKTKGPLYLGGGLSENRKKLALKLHQIPGHQFTWSLNISDLRRKPIKHLNLRIWISMSRYLIACDLMLFMSFL